MALPYEAFQNPYWVRYIEGPTLSRRSGAQFDEMRYSYGARSRACRNEPQPGYNAQSPSIVRDRINLNTDAPYIRTR